MNVSNESSEKYQLLWAHFRLIIYKIKYPHLSVLHFCANANTHRKPKYHARQNTLEERIPSMVTDEWHFTWLITDFKSLVHLLQFSVMVWCSTMMCRQRVSDMWCAIYYVFVKLWCTVGEKSLWNTDILPNKCF